MSSDGERVEPRNVTLYPSDWQIVESADISGSGFSAALRRIVREWEAQRTRYQFDPDGPDAYGRVRVLEAE